MKPTILLDMDGVSTNFLKGVLHAHGRDYTSTIREWPKGEYNIHKVLNIEMAELWAKIDEQGTSFWEELEQYEWFDKLYEELKKRGNVYFCSSPSLDSSVLPGKLKWIQQRMGYNFRNYVFTNQKQLLANNRTILIDDSPQMCERFHKFGGNVVLFPQPWNREFVYANRAYERTMSLVDAYLERIANA